MIRIHNWQSAGKAISIQIQHPEVEMSLSAKGIERNPKSCKHTKVKK
jgi:hypothetical protein